MKTKIITLLTLIGLLFGGSALTASAQTKGQNPIVPVLEAIKGRKSVTENLLGQIDHVVIHYAGGSIIGNGWNDQWLDSFTLQQLGYVHKGSFTELSSAIYSRAFSGDVVKTPDGYYDVRAELTFYTSDNRVALRGNGYLPIYEQPDGNLIAGNFEPYVDINNLIDMLFPGYISGAKWTGTSGRYLDLATAWDGKNTYVTIPVGNLEVGFLLIADGSGSMNGWDLSSGSQITGKRIYALIGMMRSSAIKTLNTPGTIDSFGNQFYFWGNRVIGRYPLLDVVTFMPMNTKAIWFTVPVWGMDGGMTPSHIFVKPLYFSGASNGREIGKEYELPYSEKAGGFVPDIPANCGFQMRIEFNDVSDWDEQDQGSGPIGLGKGGI